jgi:TonB-linked SusC/RagA family outer membrane protein
MYDRQQVANIRTANFTSNFQGPKGSLSYRFGDKYLADFVFSYQGSEQYPKRDRYGFFPAVSAGWILSEESFMDNAKFIDFLKIRASYGLTGNHTTTYFAYLETWGGGGGYTFGVTPAGAGGYTQTRVANDALTWEKCLKKNAGLDFAILGSRLSASFDFFIENNRDILVQNAITDMYGAGGVYAPVGKFENKGYELELRWNDRIGEIRYFIGANYYLAQNKIVYQNEQLRDYAWMYRTGNPLGSRYGYVFDRFFTEDETISLLPNQKLQGAYQKPGDLKYQDLNDDNVIDDNDIRKIGNPALPTANYGISLGIQTGGFDLSVLFHGTQGGTRYCSGITYWDFLNRTGNVLEHHLNRWQPGDEQNAGYPRLTLTNQNNYNASSYWIRDNSFFRLKNIEIGYTLPTRISQKAGMSRARIFLNGNNLWVWDQIGVNDPELTDNGLAFPIQRTISAGLNISF